MRASPYLLAAEIVFMRCREKSWPGTRGGLSCQLEVQTQPAGVPYRMDSPSTQHTTVDRSSRTQVRRRSGGRRRVPLADRTQGLQHQAREVGVPGTVAVQDSPQPRLFRSIEMVVRELLRQLCQ